MQTSNRSHTFKSERGNDVYLSGQRIIINLSAESAPLINTSDSYLMFSLLMGNDKTKQPNANYVVPDPNIGGMPFESMTLRSGDGATVLEQLDSMEIYEGLRNYYGMNSNDENLQAIYNGRQQLFNREYISDNSATPSAANTRIWGTSSFAADDTLTVTRPPNRGGGFQSQYYNFTDNLTTDNARKAQVQYRFSMSGLLSSLKTELLSNIVLGGVIIELTLLNNNKFLRVQKCLASQDTTISVREIGYGLTKRSTGYTFDEESGLQSFEGGADQTYSLSNMSYGLRGYYTNVDSGVVTLAPVPAGTPITGIILHNTVDKTATAATYNKFSLDNIENCSIKVGSKIRVGYTLQADTDVNNTTSQLVDSVVSSVSMIDGRVHIRFPEFTTQILVANRTTGIIALGNPVICSLTLSGTPNPVAGAIGVNSMRNTVSEMTINTARYEVSDVEYCANVVESPSGYLDTMVKQARSSKLKIQFNTWRDIRVNINREALCNEMNIPTDLRRCYSLIGVNEILRSSSILVDSISPSSANLASYQFIINGIRTPNMEVSLKRIAKGRVDALAIIETEKAIMETSIPLKNIRNPAQFITIARRLGAYGSSVDLSQKNIKCRVNYDITQPLSLLYHFFMYHTSTIVFNQGQVMVVS